MQFTVIFACFFFIKFIEYDYAANSIIIIYCKHSFKVTQTDYNAQCIFFSLVINVIICIFIILLNIITLFLLCTDITFSTMFSHVNRSTTKFICTRCWLQIFCKLCLSEELNNLINKAVTAQYVHIMLTYTDQAWSTMRFICTRCWLWIFCKLCLSKELNNLININRAVTALYSHVELTHSQKARQ